ncbi:hypothetical protein SI65_10298 [Aspergillus cristatus]|uniref:HEAT repeat domain-containing protein n=1 Tax=Aspergillus cristatus TaxID=573508 RepID=A0A1E3B0B9_ASPCR|nr:hypothetical protein SI65_10298 [Aspergillus cristatus]
MRPFYPSKVTLLLPKREAYCQTTLIFPNGPNGKNLWKKPSHHQYIGEDDNWKVRWVAVQALQNRQDLSLDTVNAITGRLEDEGWSVRQAAVEALQNRQDLSLDTMNAIAELLEDVHKYFRRAAVKALQNQQDLSLDTVNAIAGRLEHENWNVQRAAFEALRNRQSLSLDTVNQYMGSLYRHLLEKSFGEHWNWCIADTSSSIVFDIHGVIFNFKGQQDHLRNTIHNIQKELGHPCN